MKRFFSAFTLVCAIILSTLSQGYSQSTQDYLSTAETEERSINDPTNIDPADLKKLNTTDSRSHFEQDMLIKQRQILHGVSFKDGKPTLQIIPQVDFRRKGGSRSILQTPLLKASPNLESDSRPITKE